MDKQSENWVSADELEREKGLLKAVVDSAVDGILSIDREGRILSANPAALELFGYKTKELLGKNVAILMPPPYSEEHGGYLDHYHETGEKRIIGIGRAVRGLRKDGSEFPCELSVSETATADGPIYTGIIRDITSRVRSDMALRRERALLKSVVDTAIDGIIMIDERGTVISVNPAVERIFGYDPRELIGQNVRMLMPSPDRQQHDVYLRNYIYTGEKKIIGIGREVKGRKKDGTEFPLELGVSETFTEDGRIFTGIIRDITERKQHEQEILALNASLELRVKERTAELAEMIEDLEGFSNSVAHDLRAPLRAIMGNAQIAVESYSSLLDDEGRFLLTSISGAAHRLSDIMDDLLRYAKLGRETVDPKRVDLSEIAQSVIDGLPEKLDVVIEKPLEAIGDPHLLYIVLQNLIDNSYKYRRADVPLQVEIGKVAERAYFVRDNGIGFDEQYSDKLFEPFKRLHSHDSIPGSGIGLANARRIIHKHGGEIWAESQKDKGSVFYFTLGDFASSN